MFWENFVKNLKEYEEYEDYIKHQSSKTLDPVRRKKWLTEEWDLKVEGFNEVFSSIHKFVPRQGRVLCIGARTGQEVKSLRDLGFNAIGVDIVPHEDLVIKGDMHNLPFEDEFFDFIFSNVFDHALYPEKKISEIERVLKTGGYVMLHLQTGVIPDRFSENEIDNVDHDVIALFEQSKIMHSRPIVRNFAGMNWEVLMNKDDILSSLYKSIGKISEIEVPSEYLQIWNDINLPIQQKKAKVHNLSRAQMEDCFSGLQKRSYYLTLIADFIGAKNIAEVGTAQGWQYYSFANHIFKSGINGHIWSCDIIDGRNKEYANRYEKVTTFVNGTSRDLANQIRKDKSKIDMFYIDGSHQAKAVLTDIKNLRDLQSENCVWIFDDFDTRFGCFREIQMLRNANNRYKIYRVGNAASGNPNHQVIIFGKL